MDPAAAAVDTTKALQSALDAAQRERQVLTERIDEIDQLIADLSQAAEHSAHAPERQRSAGKRTGRKAATKSAAKSAAKKSAKRGQRKSTASGTTKRSTRKTTSGGSKRQPRQQPGRTDRVVDLVTKAKEPLSTGEVRAQLTKHEPDVSSQVVSASLAYAQRKGRIRRTDDGRWTPTG